MTVGLNSRNIIRRLGHDFKIARLKRRYTQQDMALKMGVSLGTVKRFEAGDPGVSIGTVVTALDALGCRDRMDGILDDTKDPIGLMLDRGRLPQRVRKSKSLRYPGMESSHEPVYSVTEDGLTVF